MFKPIRISAPAAALYIAISFSNLSAAADDSIVVVTAKRFPESAAGVTANVSVITAEDIGHSPARSIPDLLRTVAGVDIRPLYGSLGIDAAVDLRGSGDTATSNTLILLDGQRLNPVDLGSIKWETIPLSAVRQIEVVRGSGSVLYGDRASAGVINIVTDQSDRFRASLRAERGTWRSESYDAAVAGGGNGAYGSLFVHAATTDGYRVNSDARQTSAGGRVGQRFGSGEAYLDLVGYREHYGLPGSLDLAQYAGDARQSTTPNDRSERDGYRLRPGGSFKLGDRLDVAIDGSYSNDSLQAAYQTYGTYRIRSRVKTTTFTPRLKWVHDLDGAASSETIGGLDTYNGRVAADYPDGGPNRQSGQQQSTGIYIHNVSLWKNGMDTTMALRQQHFEQKIGDQLAGLQARSSDDLQAWEIGAGYRITESWRSYLKFARNFRLPNTDELFAYDPRTFAVLFNGALQPQTGHLAEAGLSYRGARYMQQLSIFEQDNRKEIGYIAANGRNANLDPTRRRGAEWEGRWYVSPAWQLQGSLTALRATFSEGLYSGKNIPLVPHHKETLGVQWDGGQAGVHNLVLVGVGSRHFGGDFNNAYDQLEGYTTLDYQAQWHVERCSVILRAANLTNRKFSAVGYIGGFPAGPTYYPADPRSFSVSLKADFF